MSTKLQAQLFSLPYESTGDYTTSLLIIMPMEDHSCSIKKWLHSISWNNMRKEMKRMACKWPINILRTTTGRLTSGSRHRIVRSESRQRPSFPFNLRNYTSLLFSTRGFPNLFYLIIYNRYYDRVSLPVLSVAAFFELVVSSVV